MTTILAFDTSTELLSIAVSVRGEVLDHEAAGGAQSSAALIPEILALIARAGVTLAELDAIAFGRGPGAFTGLRTACSVAQGLALGARKPALAVDSLLAVAQDARAASGASRVWVAMDARMDEIYAAQYVIDEAGVWRTLDAPMLTAPDALNERWSTQPAELIAGNALAAFGSRLVTGTARLAPDALPRAAAMLPIAQAMLACGEAVAPAQALPLYLREKVAQTTEERDAARAVKEAAR